VLDPRHDEAIRLAELQHGLISRSQLRGLGVDPATAARWAAGPHWEPASPEVLRRRGSARSARQDVLAAILDVGPDAHLSHLSAANLWGLAGCPLRPVHVVRLSGSRRRSTLARVHRVRRLPAAWTTELDGVPTVRPELLAMQLFDVASFERACRLTDRLWSDRLLSGPSIDRFLAEMGRRGRNGIAGLRRYLEERGPGYVPPASGLESRAASICAEAGIPLRRQVDLGADRWTARVDFLHETLPLVVEIQSERFHWALCDREADARRIRALRAAGFVVVEVTDVLVWTDPAEFVRRVLAGERAARAMRR
jgi:very-short-patch-repair endonuclease